MSDYISVYTDGFFQPSFPLGNTTLYTSGWFGETGATGGTGAPEPPEVGGIGVTCDIPIAQLTNHGRNLLARSTIAYGETGATGGTEDKSLVKFKVIGFKVGTCGYNLTDPTKVTPLIDNGASATGWIRVVNNNFEAGDSLFINGVRLEYNVDWKKGNTLSETTQNISQAIIDSTDQRILGTLVHIAPSGDTGDTGSTAENQLDFSAVALGEIGNTLSLGKDDQSILNFIICGETGDTPVNLSGGLDSALECPIYPDNPKPFGITGETSSTGSTDGIEWASMVWIGETTSVASPSLLCYLHAGETSGIGIGELGIYVQILDSRMVGEIGNIYLFAHAHYPFKGLDSIVRLAKRMIIQF